MQTDTTSHNICFPTSFRKPRLEQVFVTQWGAEPHTMGSYSFVKTGASFLPCVRALAEPDWGGRLHFAGECCSEDNFTMLQGAVETGVAAGRQGEFILCHVVTLHANPSHNLTRSPFHLAFAAGRAVYELLAVGAAAEVETAARHGVVAAAAGAEAPANRKASRARTKKALRAVDETRAREERARITKAALEAPDGALRALLNDTAQDAVHECEPSVVQSWCTNMLADGELEAWRFRGKDAETAKQLAEAKKAKTIRALEVCVSLFTLTFVRILLTI